MPFGNPGAWLLIGDDLELRQTRFDFSRAAARIRATDYPQAREFATQNVIQPPSEETMLAAFAKAELR
jgi:hypothetical protein